MKEKHARSVAKAFTWRVLATLTTAGLVYAFTGRLDITLGVGLLDVLLKIFFYYFHERLWDKIKWGKIAI